MFLFLSGQCVLLLLGDQCVFLSLGDERVFLLLDYQSSVARRLVRTSVAR